MNLRIAFGKHTHRRSTHFTKVIPVPGTALLMPVLSEDGMLGCSGLWMSFVADRSVIKAACFNYCLDLRVERGGGVNANDDWVIVHMT